MLDLNLINKMENEELLIKYKKLLNEEEYLLFEKISSKISKKIFQGLIDFCYISTNMFDSSFLNLSNISRYETFISKKYTDMDFFEILDFKIALINKDNKFNLDELKDIDNYITLDEIRDLFIVFENLSNEIGINAFVNKNKIINKTKI